MQMQKQQENQTNKPPQKTQKPKTKQLKQDQPALNWSQRHGPREHPDRGTLILTPTEGQLAWLQAHHRAQKLILSAGEKELVT